MSDSKPLGDEQLEEILAYSEMGGCDGVSLAHQVTDLLEEIDRLRAENARLKRTIDHIDPHGPSPDYAPLVAENARQAETITRLRELCRYAREAINEEAWPILDERLREAAAGEALKETK